jgi:Flp pilus assembly protein TadD
MQKFPNAAAPAALAATAWAVDGKWSDSLLAAQQWHDRAPQFQLAADQMIAAAQVQLGDLDDALSHVAPYVKSASDDPDRFGNLLLEDADIRVKMGHADQAADMLRPLLAKSAQVRLDWIKLAVTAATPEQEAQWLREVEPIIPPDSFAERLALAEQWQMLAQRPKGNEYVQAARAYTQQFVQQCAPHADAGLLLVLGSLQENQGDPAGAEASYRAALRINPNMQIAQNNLAMILAKSNRLNEALVLAQQAAQTDSRYLPDCLQTLAFVQDHLGRHDDAIASLHTALKANPKHISSLIELANILASIGYVDQAQTTYLKLEQLDLEHAALSEDLQTQLTSLRNTMSHLRP